MTQQTPGGEGERGEDEGRSDPRLINDQYKRRGQSKLHRLQFRALGNWKSMKIHEHT